MSIYPLTYKRFGEKGLLIEWPVLMDSDVLNDRVAFEKIIRAKAFNQFANPIQDIIPAYHSLGIIFQENIIQFEAKLDFFKNLYSEIDRQQFLEKHLFHIPVCYQDEYAVDMKNFAKTKGISVSDVIALHTDVVYTIYFIGFLPGFLYLGGLDERLHLPRKVIPDLAVPKGAVAIGGKQTGIYPQLSPGGWHILGNTPVEFFNAANDSPCFAYANDQIKFFAVNKEEYKHIQTEVEAGEYQITQETIND